MDNILSARNLLDSASNPRIAYGGQSSSTALNQINENVRNDLLALDSSVTDLELELAKNAALLSCQSSALANVLARTQADLATLKASLDHVPIDVYDPSYIQASTTTADVDVRFGQVTLAIAGSSDWLVATDMEGNTWIPARTALRYAANSGAIPAEGDWILDEQFVLALDGDPGTMWVESRSSTDIWVDIEIPTDVMTNGYANTLILRPFPVFCHDLVDITITSQSGGVQTLTADSLSYLPGYTAGSPSLIKALADARIFFPPTQVATIRLHLKAGAFPYWGFSEIALKTTNFQATSNLVFDLNRLNTQNRSGTPTLTLKGMDASYLAKIPASRNGLVITYGLTQQAYGLSPVITALDVEWPS